MFYEAFEKWQSFYKLLMVSPDEIILKPVFTREYYLYFEKN